ncbi:MAG: mechanosensitive ion channel family protein [Saprospiraceae bacterium]
MMRRRLLILARIVALALFIIARFNYHEWLMEFKISPARNPRLIDLLDLLLGFGIFALSANLIVVFLSWLYRRRKQIPYSQPDNVVLGLQNIYYLLLSGATIVLVLAFMGIPPENLFTSLSLVAAAIAIVSKDYISEIISGMIISFSREISIGDYIKIGNHKGKIIDLNLTKIVFLNEDDDIMYIPNNTVFNSEIVNYTRKQIKRVNIEFEVDLKAIKNVEALEADLIEAIKDYHEYIQPGSFALKIGDIKKDSLTLKFQYILNQINRELEQDIRRKTVRRVVNYVKKNLNAAANATTVKTTNQ